MYTNTEVTQLQCGQAGRRAGRQAGIQGVVDRAAVFARAKETVFLITSWDCTTMVQCANHSNGACRIADVDMDVSGIPAAINNHAGHNIQAGIPVGCDNQAGQKIQDGWPAGPAIQAENTCNQTGREIQAGIPEYTANQTG